MSASTPSNGYTFAEGIEQAVAATGEYRAGGTDLQERLRSGVSGGPLIDLFGIQALHGIERSEQGSRIAALTTMSDIATDERLREDYPALALTAGTIATPQARNRATLGGVLCQRTRCGYYRHPDLACPKKGAGDACPARNGDHHPGVAFDTGGCVHPHPSSIGCALLSYDATLEIAGGEERSIADFFGDGRDSRQDNALRPGELVTAIRLPAPVPDERAAYFRLMGREHAEWPLVEVVVRLTLKAQLIAQAWVAIGAVATIPLRLPEVERVLIGEPPDTATLDAAAGVSTDRCNPLPGTEYKLPMIRASVLEALEQAVAGDEQAIAPSARPA